MNPMFYALAVVAALLAIEGVMSLASGQRERSRLDVRRRLKKMSERLRSDAVELDEASLLRAQAEPGSLLDRIALSIPVRKDLELRLYRAALAISPERFVLMSGGLAFGGWFLASVFLEDPLFAVAAGAAAGALPWIQLARLQTQRRNEFEKQFPDALDLLIRALRAGHSLTAAFVMVGEELPDPIGGEFAYLGEEIQFGRSLREALANMAYRVDSIDLPFFITAISIQQETGSNLAEVLENLSTVMRERFKLFGKVRALTGMGRATANLLAAWPVVTFMALYASNPDYLKPLWEEEIGHMLIFISIVMVIFGYLLCRKMAKIKV
jgi:tight adherence protein B